MTENPFRSDWRLLASCWGFAIAGVFLSLSYFAPTDYYRDIFFYADAFVSSQILAQGSVPPQPISEHFNSWGKIGTRTKLPVLPLLLAMYAMITELPVNAFYLYVPAFLFSGAVFLMFFRTLPIPPLEQHLLAAAAGISMPATVTYTVNTVGLGRGLLFFSCYLIYRTARNVFSGERRNILVYQIPLLLCLVSLFYWYPPHYGKVALISGCLIVAATAGGRARTGVLVLPVVAAVLLLQVVQIPIVAYRHYLVLVIAQIATLSFTVPIGGNTAPLSTSLSSGYYSLLPLIVLLPLGLYGGVTVLRAAWTRIARGEKTQTSLPDAFTVFVVCWGVTVLLISAAYLASATAFLISRPYLFALPVIYLGAGVAVARLTVSRPRTSTCLCLAVLALVLSATALQAASTGVGIHTYEPGQRATQEWVSEYDPGVLYTDTVRGAPLAAEGYFDAIYPENETQLWAMFYGSSYTNFTATVAERDADAVLLSRGMVTEGLFAVQQTNRPMDADPYRLRIDASSRVYHDGRRSIVVPTETNAHSRNTSNASGRSPQSTRASS